MKKIAINIALLIIVGGGYIAYTSLAPAPVKEVVTSIDDLIPQDTASDSTKEPTENTSTTAIDDSPAEFLPTFQEIDVDWTHRYNKAAAALNGGTLIDINNDGIDEVFLGGGQGQDDALLRYTNEVFVNQIENTGLSSQTATYGAIAVDMNNDNWTDLIVSRNDSITLYSNNGDGTFTGTTIDVPLEPNSIPLNVTAADIDNDGHLDLYVSTFVNTATFRSAVFNDAAHAKQNLLLHNNGDNTFTDISKASGTDYDGNTFLSVFADLDNDGWVDLIVSPNTGKVTVYKNNGDRTFGAPKTLTEYGFWMGMTLGDIDQDGDQDLFVSNIGNTIPLRIARGDLRSDQTLDPEWRMIRNDGNFTFTDVTEERKLLGYEFAWGTHLEDVTLNGRLDLSVVENYIKWPPHKLSKLPARFFFQAPDGTFAPITESASVENFHYGMVPLFSDFNADGYADLLYVNLDGPVRAFLNDGGKNRAVKIHIPRTAKTVGARVTVVKRDGTNLYKQVMTNTGLLSDQSSTLIFGIGRAESIDRVLVEFPDGTRSVTRNPTIDETLTIK